VNRSIASLRINEEASRYSGKQRRVWVLRIVAGSYHQQSSIVICAVSVFKTRMLKLCMFKNPAVISHPRKMPKTQSMARLHYCHDATALPEFTN
jgi:hypothetical protein